MNARSTVSAIAPIPEGIAAASALLEQAVSAVGWIDASHRLRWANSALLTLIGRTSLPLDGVSLVTSDSDVARWQAALGRAGTAGVVVQMPAIRFGRDAEPAGVTLTALDGPGGILVELHTTPAPTAVSVASSLRSLAHELKNPLSGLRGAAQLLSRRVLDADLRAYAEIIVAEVDRLSALTNRLLVPAVHTPGAMLNVHSVLERVRLLLAADGADVERDYDPSLPDCVGDVDRLVQVVLNLGRNAVESGARHVVLRSRFERAALLAGNRGDALRVDVVDDGDGVPDALRSTLFLPLVSGRDGGTGLGLATAHEIIVEHGGRIAFDSRPGHTVFSVWLPIAGEAG